MMLTQLFTVLATALELHLARLWRWYAAFALLLLIAGALCWGVLFSAPPGFPTGEPITVLPGTSVAHEAALLREAHYIHSTLLFRVLYRLMPGGHGVQAGKYVFLHPAGELTVAWNLAHGIAGVPTVRVTFPEGTTARQMGKALAASLPAFDEQRFDSLAIPHEGFLFPDTYFFLPGTTEDEAVRILEDNYRVHISKYASRIAASGHSEREIITMASLLEGEGKTSVDRRMIAGILWRRIALGMPLQIDAPFGYVHGLTGYTPTAADIASNSGYNTYRRPGLPQTPINNPGEDSIDAALSPTKSDYLYYLTGTDGQMHYAKTFAAHIANQKAYFK